MQSDAYKPNNESTTKGDSWQVQSTNIDEIFWRDEILQVVYWYRGEGFGTAISVLELQSFLSAEVSLLNVVLERMVEDGYLIREENDKATPRYTFTSMGAREGARRFADEFAGLTNQAHGECNDPKCGCQTLGPEACSNRIVHSH